MRRIRFWGPFAGLSVVLLAAAPSPSQVRPGGPTMAPPRLVPVAETKLIMEGIDKPNFDGLTRILKEKPADAENWGYARGQALLIAESANLLLIRPPKTRKAQEVWVPRTVELRDAGVKLAEAAAAKDYITARARLADLANSCNRCHQSFGVAARMNPAPD
jgi:hypothetical protein